MKETWRLIDTGENSGSFNMALDSALLKLIPETKTPILRFFYWKPFAVSLGYGQKLDSVNSEKILSKGFEIVRRPTGGRAIFHSEELTYSVILPNNHKFAQNGITETYNRISTALLRGLKNLGIQEAEFEKSQIDFKDFYKTEDSFSCFNASARYEIVIGRKKLIGSAQKRTSDGVLQHGSILIGKSHLKLIDFLSLSSERLREKLRTDLVEKTTEIASELNYTPSLKETKLAFSQAFSETFSVAFEESSPYTKEFEITQKIQKESKLK